MTKAQIGKFFKLARAAHRNAAPDQPFEAWRHAEMQKACGEGSVFAVNHTWGYDDLMGHFAILACDHAAAAYFADAAERRVRWVLDGMRRDLEFLQMNGVGREYIEAVYRQAGFKPGEFQDATLRDLMLLIPMIDTRVRKLAYEIGVELGALPTAGAPWYFRGARAGLWRDYLDRLNKQAADAAGAGAAQGKEVLSA